MIRDQCGISEVLSIKANQTIVKIRATKTPEETPKLAIVKATISGNNSDPTIGVSATNQRTIINLNDNKIV